ncbi:hypothetical protein F2Q69_00040932 [Brassica cretica]|uniref:Uncharacterized protein n=1 Tax=Brassica cretica TaxID=69181 RepID=A0A8S9NT71_BRACR|nr:hypothetical protein F2Q69_00040932 [Brassica cretica]
MRDRERKEIASEMRDRETREVEKDRVSQLTLDFALPPFRLLPSADTCLIGTPVRNSDQSLAAARELDKKKTRPSQPHPVTPTASVCLDSRPDKKKTARVRGSSVHLGGPVSTICKTKDLVSFRYHVFEMSETNAMGLGQDLARFHPCVGRSKIKRVIKLHLFKTDDVFVGANRRTECKVFVVAFGQFVRIVSTFNLARSHSYFEDYTYIFGAEEGLFCDFGPPEAAEAQVS